MSAHVTTAMHGADMLVTVTGEADRTVARNLAKQAAGTAFIGATEGDGPYTFRVSAKSLAARKVVAKVPPASVVREATPDLSAILASLDPKVAKALRAALAANAAPAANATPKAPKAPREVPAFIVAKAKAREAAACKTCLDYGRVRTTPDAKGRLHFRTANGAATAPTGVTCPDCGTAKRGKRSA